VRNRAGELGPRRRAPLRVGDELLVAEVRCGAARVEEQVDTCSKRAARRIRRALWCRRVERVADYCAAKTERSS
jgi:hypothetical protein